MLFRRYRTCRWGKRAGALVKLRQRGLRTLLPSIYLANLRSLPNKTDKIILPLKWDNHIESMVKKTQQRLYFLRQLRKFNLPQELLIQFYYAIIESVFCMSITVWFSSATKSDLRRLRRVVRTAKQIIDTTLPTLQELYLSRVSKGLAKSLWTPRIQHTPSLNCYLLVDATEL